MDTAPISLTPEMRQAIAASGGMPVQIEDPETHQLYLLVEKPVEITLDEAYIQEELAKGLADFEAGRFSPWDIEATIAEARRRQAQNK